MIMRLTSWRGRNLTARMRRAEARGIDQTTAAAVLRAQEMAPRDTGFMASTLEWWPAEVVGKAVVGLWGNTTALYTLWVEIGARGRPGTYFMRRASDQEYPNLGGRVAAAWRALG